MECGNDFSRNVVVFGVDNTSSSHTDDRTFYYKVKNQLMIILITLAQHKKINIHFTTRNKKCCLSLHYNGNENYLYVSKTNYL